MICRGGIYLRAWLRLYVKQCLLVGVFFVILLTSFFCWSYMNRIVSGETLVIGRNNDSIGLDPAITSDTESFQVTANIYETLVSIEQGGSVILPGLAESWKVSEDGMTWQFKIRKNVKFHDGTDLNAKVVAFNFHRWMDPNSPYHTGQFIYWRYCFGGYPGIVKSVTALSEETLEIVLNEPYAPFLNMLSIPAFGIASQSAIIKYNETLKTHPVGTGPFVFKEWTPGDEIVLTRHTNYWNGQSKIGELIFKVIPPMSDKAALLSDGSYHIIDQLTAEEVEQVSQSSALRVHYRPFFNIGYLALNHSKPPFDDRDVRKAVELLIDKDELIEAANNALARPANSFLPPVVMGYHEGIKSPEKDIDKSKQLLIDAGYIEPLEVNLWVMDRPRTYLPNPVATAMALKNQLEAGHFKVTLKIIPWDQYIEDIKVGEHEMALIGWNGDIVDPDNFLYTLFTSDHINTNLSFNYANYINEKVDRLLTQARRVSNVDFRTSIYRELQEIIAEDVASIPLMHTMTAIGVSQNILGFEPKITGEEVYHKVDLQ